ncbi:PH domain-containing protein [Micromonospora soli]|uniref:PH domain-containing protein n=1 Tax=Micromonospora sp. NBRC 110009 TaxID=3061627 RepID=UPI002670DF31|nr:PH domain-containing protein [Micromonospora sp. NBRC 110009]WKT97672.1 PH domain-containing protein [Micromonospora sp. NBRC 110009]
MTRWRRPHPITGELVYVAVVLPLGVAGSTWFLYQIFSDEWPPSPFVAWPIFLVCAWLGGGWRMSRAGVFISDEGIRIRTIFRTRTLPWSSVARIDSWPTRASGFPRQTEAIWVLTRDNKPIETPLVSAQKRWGSSAPRVALTNADYHQALQTLREAHLRALGSGTAPDQPERQSDTSGN